MDFSIGGGAEFGIFWGPSNLIFEIQVNLRALA